MRIRLRSKITLLFMSLGLLLAIPAVALADNLQDNVSDNVSSALQLTAGDTTSDKTAEIRIIGNNSQQDPDDGCNFDTAAESLTIAFNTPSGVTATAVDGATATPGQMKFTTCGVDQIVKFSASSSAAAGNYTVTANIVSNGTDGTFNNQVSIPITVNPPAKQNQTISFAANTPTAKTYGDADFSVSATATSGLNVSFAPKAGSDCTVSNAGLVHITGVGSCTIVASQAGNGNYNAAPNVEHTITIDKATPTVKVNWADSTYNGNAHLASGSVEGIGTPPENVTQPALTFTYYAGTDAMGTPLAGAPTNAGTYTVRASFAGNANYNLAEATKTIEIAKANPTIEWNDPAAIDYGTLLSATQLNAQADVPGTFQYNPAAGTKLAAGNHTLTANFTPTDTGNYNNASKTVQITVAPYNLKGFYQPVDMNDTLNTVKNGSTVPVKFELLQSISGTELTSTSAITSIVAKPVNCTAFAGDPEDQIETVATGGTSLRYDTTGGQFIYNWQTPKGTSQVGKCFNLTMTAADNSTITAYFKLK